MTVANLYDWMKDTEAGLVIVLTGTAGLYDQIEAYVGEVFLVTPEIKMQMVDGVESEVGLQHFSVTTDPSGLFVHARVDADRADYELAEVVEIALEKYREGLA